MDDQGGLTYEFQYTKAELTTVVVVVSVWWMTVMVAAAAVLIALGVATSDRLGLEVGVGFLAATALLLFMHRRLLRQNVGTTPVLWRCDASGVGVQTPRSSGFNTWSAVDWVKRRGPFVLFRCGRFRTALPVRVMAAGDLERIRRWAASGAVRQ